MTYRCKLERGVVAASRGRIYRFWPDQNNDFLTLLLQLCWLSEFPSLVCDGDGRG